MLYLAFWASISEMAAVSQVELSTLKARAALGDNSAKYKLGVILQLTDDVDFLSHDERKELAKKMLEYFRAGSESGHAACMGKLAIYQIVGLEGVITKDEPAGLKLLMEAAARKDPESLFLLSDFYLTGRCGLAVDKQRAKELLEEACKAEWGPALGRRAGLLEYGDGGYAKDIRAAERGYLASAIALEENAVDLDSNEMRQCLYRSYERARRFDLARKWKDKAIDSGCYFAITDRAHDFLSGSHGETKNLVMAYAYFNLALSLPLEPFPNAFKPLAALRDDLAKEMSRAEIAEAQRLSSELNARIRK